ncbi:hypothetical protein ABT116_18875 [Streptomyces sp. NPDC002130]|uniref:hypothetical protein n=1 Tax=Streptomyces sp. NPDC002130 TaxID=3155568 RepID=UPI0033274C32
MTGTPSSAHRRLSTATAVGRENNRLVVIRGNSASGKPSVAQGLGDHYGRGIAIVGQDVIRRNVLRGFTGVLEEILYADRSAT